MVFIPVRKFGDRKKTTTFDYINRKPSIDVYAQRRIERKAKEALEKEKTLQKIN